MAQYGFLFDQSRCIGCNACLLACKQFYGIAPGPVKWMRVYQWEKGAFPDVRLHYLAIPCYHCENPVCVRACPNQALHKEPKYGAVLVDSDKCTGNRKCWKACPYGAPQFEGDAPGAKMSKCDMCFNRLEQGQSPVCVVSCPMRALEFGPLAELRSKYGNLRRLEDMPKETIADPAVAFILPSPKKLVVPWDAGKALKLWQKRQPHEGQPLPDIFASPSDVTGIPPDVVGRHRLVLKPKSVKELMYYTMDDE
ncbi:MAG: 4Fe-4S dicluster domain-containing protein [Chloroflexi bacterium]|nr:4Fe-4S dicluster domain-containing protein [Chloroflexota bacterium]